jgi:cationic amino acid transporter 14
MYLVAGMVARNYAGPGVVFSFIIAAVASIFSGKYEKILQEMIAQLRSNLIYSWYAQQLLEPIVGWGKLLAVTLLTGKPRLNSCISVVDSTR